jgi:hypothetical protein
MNCYCSYLTLLGIITLFTKLDRGYAGMVANGDGTTTGSPREVQNKRVYYKYVEQQVEHYTPTWESTRGTEQAWGSRVQDKLLMSNDEVKRIREQSFRLHLPSVRVHLTLIYFNATFSHHSHSVKIFILPLQVLPGIFRIAREEEPW